MQCSVITYIQYEHYSTITPELPNTGWSWEKRKVLWQQEELRENTLPEFDGVPYILNGTKVLECEYGVNRSVYHRTAAAGHRHATSTYHHHSSTSDQHRTTYQDEMEVMKSRTMYL